MRRAIVSVVLLLLEASSPMATRAAAGGCEGDKLPAGRSYAHCAALPSLGATLHWTYDAKTGWLLVAFSAAEPAGANGAGWVAWAVNPTGDGMKGAQALVAFKNASSSSYAVATYNVTGYGPLGGGRPTPIAYKTADLAADESGGRVRLYGKLQLAPGVDEVNHIWQVGSAVVNGAPAKHAFAKDNLDAKGKLVLSGAALTAAPAPSPAAGAAPAAKGGGGAGASSSTGGNSGTAATTYVSAPVLALMALAGFLATIVW
ncbi:hypothetical protein BS78_02G230900 [Paspalum vaginatum]|nr:hypothetical protein BS78_02G230900 [Paspalum vaginatum]